MNQNIRAAWDKIKTLEDELESQNCEKFVDFIRKLSSNKLLNRHLYHTICECTTDTNVVSQRWDLLHEFASETNK